MDAEILNTLQDIRGFIFVIMIAAFVWVSIKAFDSFLNVVNRWITAWEAHFDAQMGRLMDEGEYDEVIESCSKKLDKQPNHVNANWFIAKAYYFLNEDARAKQHFDKVLYLVPTWESDVSIYLENIKNR